MYSIQEISKKTGLSAHTLRYYEKEGLISGVERSPGGIRQYDEEDLEAIWLICCLKNTGMSLREIAHFLSLTRQGDQTLRERVEFLRKLNFFSDRLDAYEAHQKAEADMPSGHAAEEKP